jgi:hypothetical protein
MQTIKLDAHVGPDGLLKLELPVGFGDEDVEVLVVIQSKGKRTTPQIAFDQPERSRGDDLGSRLSYGEYED